MLVLITYDVNTQTASGRKRLRKVAKECTNYGQRVQNSVFECQMDAAKCRQVKNILENIIDKEVDSLRFYYLGEKYKNKVEHIGAKPGFDVTDTLILSVRKLSTQLSLEHSHLQKDKFKKKKYTKNRIKDEQRKQYM